MTVQRDGEEAVEVRPKRFAKQWAATYGQSVPYPSREPNGADAGARDQELPGENLDLSKWDTGTECTFRRATLREETYKKSKKTGTEKLRCKLDGLDAELVHDLVGLPGPVPCTLEFRTPCDDEGEIQEMIDLFD